MVEVLILAVLVLLVAVVVLAPFLGRKRRRVLSGKLESYRALSESLVEGDLQSAREALKEVIRQDTEDVTAYLRLGSVLRREGDLERAVQIYRSLLARDLRDRRLRLQILVALVETLFILKQYGEALTAAEQLRQLDRRHPLIAQVEIHEALAREDWSTALKGAETLARRGRGGLGPRATQVRVEVAARRAAEGQVPAARRILEDALREEPDFSPAWVLLGDLHAREEDYEKAAAAWTRLLRAHPRAAGIVVERIEKAYFEMGRFSELVQLYEELVAADPAHGAGLHLARVRMALRRGEPEQALALAEELLEREPHHAAALHWRLYLLLHTGRAQEAEGVLKEIVEGAMESRRPARCPRCRARVAATQARCHECGAWLPDPFANTERPGDADDVLARA